MLLAPPGTVERRYVLALALRALKPGGRLTVLAPKDKGGTRLAKELRGFGCAITEEAKRHHRICAALRPAAPACLDEAIQAGRPRHIDNLGLCTQPGIFSWDRLDPGTALLLRHLPSLSGKGADLGCGLGILSLAVLRSEKVTAPRDDRHRPPGDRDGPAQCRRGPRQRVLGGPARVRAGADRPRFRRDQPALPRWRRRGSGAGQGVHRPRGDRAPQRRHAPSRGQRPPALRAPLRAAFKTVTPTVTEGGYKLFEARK